MRRLMGLTLALFVPIVMGLIVVGQGVTTRAQPARAQPGGSFTVYLPIIRADHMRILYASSCDPRTDPHFCSISNSLTILNEFYTTIREVGATIQYTMPQSLDQLRQYDVVIANYCSSLYVSNTTPLLSEYVAQGGSVIVLGDNFCIVGGDSQGNVSAARAANALTASRGITFTMDDVINVQFSDQVLAHPATLNVNTIYSYRHAYLQVSSTVSPVVTMDARPFIGIYDGAGTLIAIPNVGFEWGNSFTQVAASDNFVFWRNALLWLSLKSFMKQSHP